MKYIKPILFYFPLTISFYLILLVLSKGSISTSLMYFSQFYYIFNMLFAFIYFYINDVENYMSIFLLAVLSFIITLIALEIIYPETLKNSVNLPNEMIMDADENIKVLYSEENKEIPLDKLDKAEYYLEIGENSSAYIFADSILSIDSDNIKAIAIKESAKNNLKNRREINDNQKYIETLKYKNLISQQRYLDAYYFCLKYNNNNIIDYDFSIKMGNCLEILLNSYYSINKVSAIINLHGYSDIKFYSNINKLKLYKIEKLVEYEGEIYIKNLKIDNVTYPYIYIDKDGNIFSKGFNEIKREVHNYSKPDIPIKPEDLKLFSKELYGLSKSSLYFNIRVFNNKNVNYFQENILIDLILKRFTGYLSIFIIFFMVVVFRKNKSFLNYLFAYTGIILAVNWYIKKIGLITMYYGLNLSFIFVFILYCLWILIILKKTNRQLSLF